MFAVSIAKDKNGKYAAFIWQPIPPCELKSTFGGLSALSAKKYLFKDIEDGYSELTINQRQKDDQTYVDLLSRVRLGATTAEDHELLASRVISILDSATGTQRQRRLDSTVWRFLEFGRFLNVLLNYRTVVRLQMLGYLC